MIFRKWLLAGIAINIAGLQCLTAQHPVCNSRRVPLAFSEPVTTPGLDHSLLSSWSQIRRVTELLKTDDGVLALWRENPQLTARFANEFFFLEFVRQWRDRVSVLPKTPDLMPEESGSWTEIHNGEARTVNITFRHPIPQDAITIMSIRWEYQQMANISFMRGFENVALRRHHHRGGHRHNEDHDDHFRSSRNIDKAPSVVTNRSAMNTEGHPQLT